MKFLGSVVTCAAAMVACTAFGYFFRDLRALQPPSVRSIERLVGFHQTGGKVTGEQVFKQNYTRILADYVKPVKRDGLKYAGISGMMASLGDPHTIFLPPQAAQAFNDETQAHFSGVGARLGADSLGAKVANVFEDGPAFASGLRSGDIITAVDGKSVVGKDIDDIVSHIKGKEGTSVQLTVIRGTGKSLTMSIKRARLITPTVESKVVGDHIGYMTISQFSEPTTAQFDHELNKLDGLNIKGLVIDLRDNPGGLLETATDMLSRFVEDKVVVTMKFRDGNKEVPRTSSGDLHHFSYPIVVLINQDSASAAEIFSGNLKDYGKATLVGTHSYGKASVQNVFPLVDQSSAKITIAKYYLPGGEYIGRAIDADGVFLKGGLEPDVKVDLNTDVMVTFGDIATDNQLDRAIEVLKSKM